jgi:hypothetical protein
VPPRDYFDAHPSEASLIIEVAESSRSISGDYTRVAPCRKGEHVTLTAFPDLAIALDDVLR